MAYEPNLSIIVPGPCNAKCGFCFWKDTKNADKNYIAKLEAILDNMPEEFQQISLTGGEPTLSPYLADILRVIDKTKYKKVVLTSNGTKLQDFLDTQDVDVINQIDHINISRHHYNEMFNSNIFKSKSIISNHQVQDLIDACHVFGIDANLNCVLTDKLKTKGQIDNYLDWAKMIGADSVCFRKQHGTLDPSPQELFYKDCKLISEGNCPVCRTKVQSIGGQMVIWKASRPEPSEVVVDDVYEVIIHPDCRITLDWAGNKPYVNMDCVMAIADFNIPVLIGPNTLMNTRQSSYPRIR